MFATKELTEYRLKRKSVEISTSVNGIELLVTLSEERKYRELGFRRDMSPNCFGDYVLKTNEIRCASVKYFTFLYKTFNLGN